MEQYRELGWLGSEVESEDERRRKEAQRLGIPFVVLERDDLSLETLVRIPEPFARTHQVIAYAAGPDYLEVALLSMEDLAAVEALFEAHPAPLKIKPRLTSRESIKRALLVYQKYLKEKFAGMAARGIEAADSLLQHALLSRAIHIHLEPSAAAMLVRYRIGGALHEAMRLPEAVGQALVERFKSLAKLFPVTSAAQEGRFRVEHGGEVVTASVSTVPLADNKEKMLIRLARERYGQKGFTLPALGFHGRGLERLHELLAKKEGVLLVVGPRKAGKTTTLYTLLDELNDPAQSIATIEERIEYTLPHVAQTVVRPEVGLDMAAGLRVLLKNDPDIVLVGDISSEKAAELAAQAVRRGIFVLAGLESEATEVPAPAIVQRLFKKLCPACKQARRPAREELDALESHASFGRVLAALKEEEAIEKDRAWKELNFYAAGGCAQCEEGFNGSVGVQEVLLPMQAGDGSKETPTLIEDALFKAALGQIDITAVVSCAQAL